MARKGQRSSELVMHRNGERVPLTAKDQRSAALVLYRDVVRRCARLFQDAVKASKQGADAYFLFRNAELHLLWLLDWKPNNLGQVLGDIGLAAEGKLGGKNQKLDDIYIDAWWELHTGLARKKHVSIIPQSGNWYENVKTKCERKGVSPPPTSYAAKRRMRQLGYSLQNQKTCHGAKAGQPKHRGKS